MTKIAVCQVADQGPLESLVVMLRSVGYDCYLPDDKVRGELRSLGCDTVVDIRGLVENWGYEYPFKMPTADMQIFQNCDLYVDVKAHRSGPKIWEKYPNLRSKTLYYRINGGKPEHVINTRGDMGNEINPPCPILTPNLWYRIQNLCYIADDPAPWASKAYACWPPFYRFHDYYTKNNRVLGLSANPQWYLSPICFVHNLQGWGYGALTKPFQQLGIKLYGRGSPDGLIQHRDVPDMLSRTLAYVHLKSSDAPGYALYEALAAACPVVCTRRLIWRNKMEDLFILGKTCLVFDRETHDPLSESDVKQCTVEVEAALNLLRDPVENRRIGLAGHERLKELMWNSSNPSDVSSLGEFMSRMFPE